MSSAQARLFAAGARARGRSRRNFDATLKALRADGRIDDSDSALVALCRYSFDLLDAAEADPDETRFVQARLIAEARATLSELIRGGASDTGGALELELERMFAEVGDGTQPGPTD